MPKDKLSIAKPEDFLAEMREFNKEMTEGLSHIHDAGMEDIEMLLGENQWDDTIRKWREDNKRPCITQNMLPAFTDQVKNDQRQSRPQIKAIPVDDKGDPKTANVIAGLIRNIWYQSQAESIHDGAFDQVVDCGLGAWRIQPEYEGPMSFNQELRLQPIENPFSVIWDLSCKKFDTSDKKKCLIHDVIPEETFKKLYPNAEVKSSLDAPQGVNYADWYSKDGIRVAEYWYTEEARKTILLLSNGQVIEKKEEGMVRAFLNALKGVRVVDERITTIPQIRSCICSGAEILEGPFEFPGQYIPVIIAFGKILNVQGKKHIKSLIRDAKETQQIHNYLMTSMIESYAMQPNVPWTGSLKNFEGLEKQWESANIGGQAYLPFNPDPNGIRPERAAPPAISNQLFPMVEGNKQTMRNIIGIYESGLGAQGNETSGRAIIARQKEGDNGSFVFLSNMLMAIQFEGRILSDLIPHYYDAPRAAMITGLEGEHMKVMLNQQHQGPDGKPILYDMKAGKYDTIITTGPSFASQRQETLQGMIDLMQPTMTTNPNAGSVLLYEIVKNIDTVNGELLQKLIKATLPPQLQQILDQEQAAGMQDNPQFAQMRMMLEQQVQGQVQELQGTIEQLQAELQKAQAQEQAQIAKVEADREKTAAEIQIEREKVTAEFELKREIAFEELKLKAQQIAADNQLKDKAKTAELLSRERLAGTREKPYQGEQ